MCRMVVFAGYCTVCTEYFTWDDLSQELSCLEAKNNGVFGDCRKGIQIEEHNFDQECDHCAESNAADEGVEIDIEENFQPAQYQETYSAEPSSSSSKGKQKAQEDHSHHGERNRKRQRVS